jgi:hypothetical protein
MVQKIIGKGYLAAVAWLLMAITPAFAGVTVSSPQPGATVGSPVQFVASASSTNPISAMSVYVDGQRAAVTLGGNLNIAIPIDNGTHSIVVQAWDTSGAVLKFPETITVRSTAGVDVTSPAGGSTVGSPIPVAASASGAFPIAAMRIYLDGNSVFSTQSSQLSTSVAASSGSHSLVVQAWDTSGAVYKQSLTVNVGSSGSSPTPTPSGTAVFNSIQRMSGWQDCTTCAGAGGSGPSATFWSQQGVTSPSLSGDSMEFHIGGSTPYSDAIWWKQLGAQNNATNFQYDLDFFLTNPELAEALEFDVNQSIGSRKFIYATQCNIKSGAVWDVWDGGANVWRSTGIPCPMPSANQWHHLTWELSRDSAYTHFVAVTLDGVRHVVNFAFPSRAVSASELNVAFQMDGDFAQHPYSAWLDNVTLHFW